MLSSPLPLLHNPSPWPLTWLSVRGPAIRQEGLSLIFSIPGSNGATSVAIVASNINQSLTLYGQTKQVTQVTL